MLVPDSHLLESLFEGRDQLPFARLVKVIGVEVASAAARAKGDCAETIAREQGSALDASRRRSDRSESERPPAGE